MTLHVVSQEGEKGRRWIQKKPAPGGLALIGIVSSGSLTCSDSPSNLIHGTVLLKSHPKGQVEQETDLGRLHANVIDYDYDYSEYS